MFSIIRETGWTIWPLLICSCVMLAIILERLFILRRSRIMPKGLTDEVFNLLKRQQLSPDIIGKLELHSPLGRLLAIGIKCRHLSTEQAQARIEETGSHLYHQLNQRVSALSTIATLAPLMGLFGTVVGMIEIFGAYKPGTSDPSILAHGISIALYNTGFGIFIAIPAVIFHRWFKSHIESMMIDLELISRRLLDKVQGSGL